MMPAGLFTTAIHGSAYSTCIGNGSAASSLSGGSSNSHPHALTHADAVRLGGWRIIDRRRPRAHNPLNPPRRVIAEMSDQKAVNPQPAQFLLNDQLERRELVHGRICGAANQLTSNLRAI